MTDQQNFEPQRPASADPAVALAEMLGQLPKPAEEQAKPAAPKVSVEDLAQELGLKLGDQNELTIRRIKRGKNYSFVRANGTRIKHVGTIRRLHRMAVPPAYREVRYCGRPQFASAGGRHRRRRPAAIPLSRRLGEGARAAQGASPGQARRGASEDPPQRLHASRRRGADAGVRAVGRDRADRAHRDPSRQ